MNADPSTESLPPVNLRSSSRTPSLRAYYYPFPIFEERSYLPLSVELTETERVKGEMEQPPSPGTTPVELRDCIEKLMKFTLQAHIDQSLGFDLCLSKDFCFHLLNDSYNSNSGNRQELNSFLVFSWFCFLFTLILFFFCPNCLEQALPQLLYQRLAFILCEIITYASFSETTKFMESHNLENDVRERRKWEILIWDEGTQLLNVCA